MNTKDIYARINQILVAKNGRVIPMIPKDKYERAKDFEQAMLEYLVQKLPITPETETIVLDLGIIFDLCDMYLQPGEEYQEFYRHIVHSYVYALSELTDDAILWEVVDESTTGEFPQITGEYTKFMQTKKSMSNKDIALWISNLYKEKQQKPKQNVK